MRRLKQPTVVVRIEHGRLLRIYLGGLPHLSVQVDSIAAVHAYSWRGDRFCVDYELKCREKPVETWYASRETWESVLRGLAGLSLV